MKRFLLLLAGLAVFGVLASGNESFSFAVYFVQVPEQSVIYDIGLTWELTPLLLGFSVSLAGSADVAMSPTLGIPLLYGLLSDIRLQYDVGIRLWKATLGWSHICYYSLASNRHWSGSGAELFWIKLDF